MAETNPTIEEPVASNGKGSKQKSESSVSGSPVTMAFEVTTNQDPNLTPSAKQLDDAKFALSVVATGKMSEQDLVSSLTEWTAFGNLPLSDHLVSIGKINQRDVDTVLEHASTIDDDSVELSEQLETTKTTDLSDSNGNSSPAISLELSHFARTIGINMAYEQTEPQLRRVGTEYRLIRKLGQGGLGSVWLARDEILDRNVAIKELTDDNSSESALERFRREARVTGQLDHPNIVTVHQYGADETTGKAFYAMRFVGKKTLGDAITEYHDSLEAEQDGTAQLNEILTAYQTVCQAIAFAHSRGVIHRDLKPENIALDNFGQVSVIDWGLAKSFNEPEYFDASGGVSGGESSGVDRTMAGQVVGTPIYMSPEQASGRIDDIDERTDVYGLGAILFHILAGRPPHLPGNHQSGDSSRVEHILDSIMKQPSPAVRDVRPDAPPELASICARAMNRKKSRRYASATDLADAVKGWVDGIADRTRRFELLKSQAREIEMRVTSTAVAISRDARFASSLPPIQGMIDSLNERDQGDGLAQWSSRLESIFAAMLRTNQNLHALGFAQVAENEVIELSRVQRNSGDTSFIHCVPNSRLARVERTVCFDRLQLLDPGDVDFSIRPCETQKRRLSGGRQRLSAWIPIFDEVAGDQFGVVSIEVDLQKVISDYLLSLDAVSNSIYVVDSNDNLWVSRHDKAHCTSCQMTKSYLIEKCPELSTVFDGTREVLELESELVARRFTFGQPELGFELFVICIV